MRRRVASYYRKGFMSSRRARAAVANNEHPVSYWIDKFSMDKNQIEKLLIYMGNHHVGARGRLVPFYRLPDKNDPSELTRIYTEFHKVVVNKINFIRILADHFNSNLHDKGRIIPISQRPRKKTRRNRSIRRGKRARRKSTVSVRKVKATYKPFPIQRF